MGKKEEILVFKLKKKDIKNLYFLIKYIIEFGWFIIWRLWWKFFQFLYFSQVFNIIMLYLCVMGEVFL